jgi:AraC-like DNA-binding protein
MNAMTSLQTPIKRKVLVIEAEKKAIKDYTINVEKKQDFQTLVGIEEISKEFNMSPSKFKNLFKEVNGDSYYSYFLKNRLAKAALMFEKGKRLKDVSNMMGYSQPIKFLIVFKKYYGTTSKKYSKGFNKVD